MTTALGQQRNKALQRKAITPLSWWMLGYTTQDPLLGLKSVFPQLHIFLPLPLTRILMISLGEKFIDIFVSLASYAHFSWNKTYARPCGKFRVVFTWGQTCYSHTPPSPYNIYTQTHTTQTEHTLRHLCVVFLHFWQILQRYIYMQEIYFSKCEGLYMIF